MLVALKSEKMPNHTDTWGNHNCVDKIWKIPNHQRHGQNVIP